MTIVRESSATAMMTTAYIEDGSGNGYSVQAVLLDPDVFGELSRAGYRDLTVLYTVFSAEVVSSHDRYKVARELPGDTEWLLDDLEAIGAKLHDRASNGVDP